MLDVTNPTTGALIRQYPKMSELSALDILERVARSQAEWRETDFPYRAERTRVAADVLRGRSGEFAELMTLEMGKPIEQARSEVEKCAVGCEYYADHAERMLAPETANTDAARSYWTYRPLGIVLVQCSQSLFRFADLGDDGLCRGGPDKGCGVIVSAIDVVVDRLD